VHSAQWLLFALRGAPPALDRPLRHPRHRARHAASVLRRFRRAIRYAIPRAILCAVLECRERRCLEDTSNTIHITIIRIRSGDSFGGWDNKT
jgi:hypothetical protein